MVHLLAVTNLVLAIGCEVFGMLEVHKVKPKLQFREI